MKIKGLAVLVPVLLSFALAGAAGQKSIESAAMDAFMAVHPDFAVAAQAQRGDTSAAVLSKDGSNVLCVAEKQNGVWNVTIDNPAALRQGDVIPDLLLDADNELCWRYVKDGRVSAYAAFRQQDGWGNVSMTLTTTEYNGATLQTGISLQKLKGTFAIVKTTRHEDENGNLRYTQADMPIPADAVAAFTPLAAFDNAQFPSYDFSDSWASSSLRKMAAAQLMPDYEFVGGVIQWDSLEFLMEKPSGTLVFVGVAYEEPSGWVLTESAPLPEGTAYGRDNFTSSLYWSREMSANVKLYADGTWGIDYVYATPADGTPNEFICFGKNWIADSTFTPDIRYYGTHPWSDITTIDWSTLPSHLDEALRQLDSADWAVVSNPNPEDLLHLRTKPRKDAPSLGKYYNGTAVQVRETAGDWVKVSVCGVEGYMSKESLAFGEAMNTVMSVGPYPYLLFVSQPSHLYQIPQSAEPFAAVYDDIGLDMRIIGVVGDEWFHVWFASTGLSGYARQEDLYPEID